MDKLRYAIFVEDLHVRLLIFQHNNNNQAIHRAPVMAMQYLLLSEAHQLVACSCFGYQDMANLCRRLERIVGVLVRGFRNTSLRPFWGMKFLIQQAKEIWKSKITSEISARTPSNDKTTVVPSVLFLKPMSWFSSLLFSLSMQKLYQLRQ